ncbi:MAG: hypothetical protein IKF18_05475 [Erysipelotrichaceae bacterium]|nr:hypothetical protein [Erysipelotrichaceae bacterium]MBR3168113.1 hypothetical protein [Erysipelotrichaceae bacterium]
MDVLESVFARAEGSGIRVCFPEATEEKILLASREVTDKHYAVVSLAGDPAAIKAAAAQYNVDLTGIDIIDTTDEEALEKAAELYAGTTTTMLSKKAVLRRAKADPMYAGLMYQAIGDVDVCFAGLTHTTGEVILGGQMVIGLADGVSVVSSVGIFNIPGYEGSEGQLLAFGDSAVNTNPSDEDLASIAISCCDTIRALLGWEPRCAMLSFSTDGSMEHSMVDKVRSATKIANELRPDLLIDGEFQFDSAVSPRVAAKKVRHDSKVAGRANIVIWPDLNAGNIGVKLVQYLARADAYGPMLQGFRKIVCDCSRGAPVSELVGNVAMSVVRAKELKTLKEE